MFIFEWISKFIKGKTYKASVRTDYIPSDGEGLLEDPKECEHIFMPLDSSEELFACKYCGIIIRKENLK